MRTQMNTALLCVNCAPGQVQPQKSLAQQRRTLIRVEDAQHTPAAQRLGSTHGLPRYTAHPGHRPARVRPKANATNRIPNFCSDLVNRSTVTFRCRLQMKISCDQHLYSACCPVILCFRNSPRSNIKTTRFGMSGHDASK